MERMEETARKYYHMKRGMKLMFGIPIKGGFADVNKALDSVLQGTQSRLCWLSTYLGDPLFLL